jgi:hypothetical protein
MKKVSTFLLACAAALVLVPAHAGYRAGAPVFIGSFSATGTVATVRSSADNVAEIGCGASGYAGGSYSASCWAWPATGSPKFCYTSSPTLANVALSVAGDSDVWFSWDASGNCTQVYVRNSSAYAPKAP